MPLAQGRTRLEKDGAHTGAFVVIPFPLQIPLAHQSLKLGLADEWNGLGTVDDIKPA